MKIQSRRQRNALYAGVADMPLQDIDKVVEQFEYGYRRKPHMATLLLMYDMHRLRMPLARRTLPGILTVA